MDDTSPVFEPPGAKRTHKTDERVLGEGRHAEVTLKLAVVRIHKQLVRGELVTKSKVAAQTTSAVQPWCPFNGYIFGLSQFPPWVTSTIAKTM